MLHVPAEGYRPELLSVREQEVLDLAVTGRTDEQIAQALGLSTARLGTADPGRNPVEFYLVLCAMDPDEKARATGR